MTMSYTGDEIRSRLLQPGDEEFHLVDALVAESSVRVAAIFGRSSLIEYRPA